MPAAAWSTERELAQLHQDLGRQNDLDRHVLVAGAVDARNGESQPSIRPTPAAANGLDGACWPATVSHHGIDGNVRLMQEATEFNLHRGYLHKIPDISCSVG